MGFKYRLTDSDGEDVGNAEYAHNPQAGDVIYVEGNKRAHVLSVIPVERIAEFVDGALEGVLEVEPV